jgi:hypothetical protein
MSSAEGRGRTLDEAVDAALRAICDFGFGQLRLERIELDVWYVEHRSPWVDLKIVARTPLALFGGTYKGETGGWRA